MKGGIYCRANPKNNGNGMPVVNMAINKAIAAVVKKNTVELK